MEESSLNQLQYILKEELFLVEEEISDLSTKVSQNPLDSSSVKEPNTEKYHTEKEEQIELTVQKEPIPVRGSFKKGILILHEEDSLAPAVMEMLVKIINAVGHSMNEVGMLNSKELEGRSMEEFKAINAHVVLKFGTINHPINALVSTPYESLTEEETEYLFADSLSTISEDQILKKKLWDSLRVLFNISQKK
ncbi:hypothetical protein [Algoriphagus sp. CAU 1675]|uniref:hypothetical protein n=1 Tax=Algoriphagus sp. CAU 1675 TaxID=3032597 RepID=UPI0023D99173|nr:hypothetical protein [Algoriphagus sp. CAU 1675]MDF2157830.1 hypothetical protein [Algoriphagus sp. CAU 1675]